MDERIRKQLAFALEIDKEKKKYSQTDSPVWSWQTEKRCGTCMAYGHMAYLLREYANEEVNITKVMLMCLIHDIVEIEAGDTYAYDEEGLKSQKEREERAKEKLYSLLPDDQKRELVSLFDEFESYESPEARFAHAMDNVQPLILNDSNEGGDWKDHQVSAELVYGRHKKTKLGSEKLYEVSDENFAEKY